MLSREKTEKEVRDEFIGAIKRLIEHWENVPDVSSKERLEGISHSILTILDGGSCDLPKFIVAPDPHPADKKYRIKNEEDYYPENHVATVKCDISGYLNDLFYKQ